MTLALGSDGISGEEPFAAAREEALFLSTNGLVDNLALLKMWRENTPRAIFPKRKIGALLQGYEASFLVLDGNPLLDFTSITGIVMRIKQGRVIS